jgi:hypothetical protein
VLSQALEFLRSLRPRFADERKAFEGVSAERTARDSDGDDVDLALRRYLLYFLVPLWYAPGLADWWWHRQTKIEETSGTHESMTHAIMMTVVGVPLLAGLLFDINALVLVMMMAGYVVHEGVTYWDVNYAKNLREVPTIEQHTHSFLEMLPFMAASMAICLKPKQFAAIFGRGDEPARWKLEPKNPPLTARYVLGVLGGVLVFVIVPYGEEFVRCFTHDHTLKPHHPSE